MNCRKIQIDRNYNITIKDSFEAGFAYIYILLHNASNGEVSNGVIIRDNIDLSVTFKTFEDGFYTLITLVIPKDPLNYFYYSEGKVYRAALEVELSEILDTNPSISFITPLFDYYFITARLKKCYIEACQDIFQSKCFENKNSDLVYKRDLIWSALNVIEYMAEFGQYEEAQRLLEELTSCNGICLNKYNKCGCQK